MQSRKLSLGLAAGAIAVAVVLFIVLREDERTRVGLRRRPHDHTGGPPRRPPRPKPPKVASSNGAPVGGVQEIEVAKGDPVRIDVTPDVPAEVHVHGYELTKEVKAGQTAKFDFPATAEGVFEIEVHHLVNGEEGSGVQVAELKVTP